MRHVGKPKLSTDRDRKQLLRALLQEVVLNLKRADGRAHLTLHWRGGAITMLDVPDSGHVLPPLLTQQAAVLRERCPEMDRQ